ncbi:hypothetical protein M0802_016258 [Mischocyttarus mexicanus]|nr:hypothetical protein M0802_016258 [Mischocyttarus mexicanus]
MKLNLAELSMLTFLLPLTSCKRTNYEIISSSKLNSSEKPTSSLTIGRFSRGTVTDIVSKNITMVLENLLMNYENSQLPSHGKGTPTIVKTNILIRSMGPVSELDMVK